MITEINGQLEYGIGCEEDINASMSGREAAASSVRESAAQPQWCEPRKPAPAKHGLRHAVQGCNVVNQEIPNDCAKLPRAVLIPDA
jgi:hypothetical protein